MEITQVRWTTDRGWSEALPQHDGESTLVLAFGDSDLHEAEPTPFTDLRAAFANSTLVGCSSAGHAFGVDLSNDGLFVTVIRFEDATIRLAVEDVPEGASSEGVGRRLAQKLPGDDPHLTMVFCLADGLEIDGTDLAAGLGGSLPTGVVIAGCMAADADHFRRTWVFDGDTIARRRAVAVSVAGPRLHAGCSQHGGWDAFGPDRRITESDGDVVSSLDDKQALTLYRNYLGALAVGLPATALLFPLAVRDAAAPESEAVVRMVLSTDGTAKSMRFGGRVPANGFARMLRAGFEQLIDAAQISAETAVPGSPRVGVRHGPLLGLGVSCVGRRLALGDRASDELDAALHGLPNGSRLSAVYGYGQLAPHGTQACCLHNQTIAVTAIWEEL